MIFIKFTPFFFLQLLPHLSLRGLSELSMKSASQKEGSESLISEVAEWKLRAIYSIFKHMFLPHSCHVQAGMQ